MAGHRTEELGRPRAECSKSSALSTIKLPAPAAERGRGGSGEGRTEVTDLIAGSFVGGFNQDWRTEINDCTYMQSTETEGQAFGASHCWLLEGSTRKAEVWM